MQEIVQFRNLIVRTHNSTGDYSEELVAQYRSRLANLDGVSTGFGSWGPWKNIPSVTESEADAAAEEEASAPFDLNEYAKSRVRNAVLFGEKLKVDFASVCLLQGINESASPTLAQINAIMEPVNKVLQTGSLVEALQLLHTLPLGSYDSTFVTPAKVLQMVNSIEAFIGLPTSEHLMSGAI